jgi:tripartite-type tricarboxylate transporter receptor subunit TctC
MWASFKMRARAGLAIAGVLTIASAFWGTPAYALYPDKPVRIIVPYGPGGVADVTMRLVAQKLSERMGQQFVIENRPGAGGIVAAKAAATSTPDGYTLYLNGNGAAISVSLFKSMPYDVVRDFTSISMLAQFDMLLATKAGSQFDSVQKLVAYARANPGKLNFGSIAPGSTQHLSAELFRLLSGIQVAIVTFRTTPDLVTALMRDDVAVGFDYFAALRSGIVAKQLSIIATSGSRPIPQLPGVPTVKDSGYPDYLVTSWNALSGPTGIPSDIVMKLNSEVNAVLAMPEVKERIGELGMEAIGSTPEKFTERMNADIEKWRRVIEKSGVERQ